LVLPHKNSKSHKNNGITKDVAKIILTALVAFIFSSAFWVAILPNNTLTITIPPQDENKTSTVTANTFPIEWELETQQWFTKGVDRKSPANIRVLKDGLFEVQSLEAQVPGITIELDSGIYDLEVISIETDVSDKMRVIVSP
jgi:hypothetical protein